MSKPKRKSKKAIIADALAFARDIVDARHEMMLAIADAYFAAHPEARKYRDEIMAAADRLAPRAPF